MPTISPSTFDSLFSHSDFDSSTQCSQLVQEILRVTRLHFDMEVAFVSRFIDGMRQFEYVDSNQGVSIVSVGGMDPVEQSYCYQVVNQVTPQLICDAQCEPSVAHLAATKAVPVGAHLSVPIYLPDGSCYGTFCILSREANSSLDQADFSVFKIMADVVTQLLVSSSVNQREFDLLKRKVAFLMSQRKIYLVVQPIVSVLHGIKLTQGYEVLCRVDGEALSPELLFADAKQVGLSIELNSYIVREAFKLLPKLKANQYLSINVTPDFVASDTFVRMFDSVSLNQVVLEITEHAAIQNYALITNNLYRFKKKGLKIAIDDMGAGYSNFRHILLLHPDIIKIDRSLIENIDQDIEKQRLVSAFTTFAREMKYQLIAEGVETTQELDILKKYKIDYIQGYLFAKPDRPEKIMNKSERNLN